MNKFRTAVVLTIIYISGSQEFLLRKERNSTLLKEKFSHFEIYKILILLHLVEHLCFRIILFIFLIQFRGSEKDIFHFSTGISNLHTENSRSLFKSLDNNYSLLSKIRSSSQKKG